jgi:hypothetical protein
MDHEKRRPTSADPISDLQVLQDHCSLGHLQLWFLGMRLLGKEQENGKEEEWDPGDCDTTPLTHPSLHGMRNRSGLF